MGRYLAVRVRLAQPEFPMALIEALSSSTYFRPASLAGIEGHESGDHWFLSGYALEDFISRFAPRAPATPASIQEVAAPEGTNASYLALVAHRLRSGQPQLPSSPFERVSAQGGATFLEDWRIDGVEARAEAQWFKTHSDGSFYLYGSFALDVIPDVRQSARWDLAFREVADSPDRIGPPYVLISGGRDPLTKTNTHVTLTTWSRVWLRTGEAFGVGPAQASENLRRLATLVEIIQGAERNRLVSSSLHIEGQPFVAHEAEIRAVIRDVGAGD